jgi:hypothetical protein
MNSEIAASAERDLTLSEVNFSKPRMTPIVAPTNKQKTNRCKSDHQDFLPTYTFSLELDKSLY